MIMLAMVVTTKMTMTMTMKGAAAKFVFSFKPAIRAPPLYAREEQEPRRPDLLFVGASPLSANSDNFSRANNRVGRTV